MGSEGTKTLTIHVTGFEKFLGVADNPTETIIKNLKVYVERQGLPSGVTLGNCIVLQTAGDGALPKLQASLESGLSSSEQEQVLWLHLGVNSGANKFAVERLAANEAHFRCPDELGWQPQRLPIAPEDGGTSVKKETSCSAGSIVEFLKKKGYDVVVSNDAGRFVCNYVYYHSLRFAEKNGHKSLFVHVPLFTTISEETQMRFVASLFEAIASTC